ncbi:helix-turn-helix transcriptional regulator [Kineococcus arenarius]|uniref:helix-turn-helix transcriptional regulator n=1 Tax=unclassified Kineococcus TaxID=2621656 RepID=UPI003D7ECC91
MTGNPGTLGVRRTATPSQLGQVLADLRHQAGMNQQELAEWAAVSRQYVSLLENGEASLQVKRLFDMFAVLGHDLAVVPRGDATVSPHGPGDIDRCTG